MFPGYDQPSKKPCLFQPAFSSASVDWYRPPSGWFNVLVEPTPPRPLKRGRDSIDDLADSMKRLRTEDEHKTKTETEAKESTSTALVVTRPPTSRCRLLKSRRNCPDPDYSLPPPMGSFPVVLYKGPPSPTVGRQYRKPRVQEMEELSLSRHNRTLRVSPSMTIELIDDDEEDETLPPPPTGSMIDEPLPSPRSGPTMTDDD